MYVASAAPEANKDGLISCLLKSEPLSQINFPYASGIEYLRRRACLKELAGAYDIGPVANTESRADIMVGDENAYALFLEVEHYILYVAYRYGVYA